MENNNVQKVKIDAWDAILIFDDENNKYTITYSGSGGAIVSDYDLEVAKKKFIDGMTLAEATKN